jgi:hypothetical protein
MIPNLQSGVRNVSYGSCIRLSIQVVVAGDGPDLTITYSFRQWRATDALFPSVREIFWLRFGLKLFL